MVKAAAHRAILLVQPFHSYDREMAAMAKMKNSSIYPENLKIYIGGCRRAEIICMPYRRRKWPAGGGWLLAKETSKNSV